MKNMVLSILLPLILSGCSYAESTPNMQVSYKSNAVIVEFYKGVSKIEINKFAVRNKINYIRFLNKQPESGYIVLIRSRQSADTIKALLEKESIVKSVQLNYKRKALEKR